MSEISGGGLRLQVLRLLLALFILGPLAVCSAAPLGIAEATAQARPWMLGHPVMGTAALREIRESTSFPGVDAPYSLYILQLAPTGYLILNSDDRLPLVVAFSADSALSLDDVPENSFRAFLAQYAQQTAEQLANLPLVSKATTSARATAAAQSADELIGPLMDTTWNQCNPYNLYAPADPAGTAYYGYRAPTGCVPTAFSQVLNYHRWPVHGEGSYTYTDTSGSIQGAHAADFSDPYDWGAMQGSYDAFGANPAAAMAAVAELSDELGVAAGANYESSGTSGTSSSTSVLAAQLAQHFYFTNAVEQTSQSALMPALVADLHAGYPVVVTLPGHAVVADGLLTSGGSTTYHINYGWGGTNNGWWTPANIPGGPFQTGITSLIPKLMPFPVRDSVVVAAGAPCELQWVLPKRREQEANQLNLYQRVAHPQPWTTDASSFGRANVSGWSVVAGGKIGSCWYAGPNGPALVDMDETLIPTATTNLQFWGRYQIASATFKVSVTADNGATFTELLSRNNQYSAAWWQESVSLAAYAGKRIRLRFELTSGSYYTGGGVWVDELALTSGTWEGWSPLVQGLGLTSQRFSSVITAWDEASDFSKFAITSTSSYLDWVINTPETGITGFYKAPSGYSNKQYHLTSLATITPAANTRLRLRAKYNLATDVFRVLASTSRTANFQVVATYGGTSDWGNLAVDLSAYAGQAIYIRLEYVVGSYYADGGVWIDSVATEQITHPELEGQPIHFTVPSGIAPGNYQVAGALTNLSGQEQPMSPAFTLQVQASAFLSSLSLSAGTLNPAFAAATTSYTAAVSNATTSMTVTSTVADASATIKVNGTAVASGASSGSIALYVGTNTITTIVTAQDGSTTKTYTVTVTRAASASGGYAAWITTYSGLADVSAAGDPDHDGVPNLLEYVLNGNPGIASSACLPVVTKVAGNFVFALSRREASAQDTTQIFQYGSDLSHWTDVSVTGTKGTEVTLGAADGAGVQSVKVTIPQGTSPTMFGRLKVLQP